MFAVSYSNSSQTIKKNTKTEKPTKMSNKQKRKQKFKTVKRVWNAGTVYKAPSIVCQIRCHEKTR